MGVLKITNITRYYFLDKNTGSMCEFLFLIEHAKI